jgi:hypothetical protein
MFIQAIAAFDASGFVGAVCFLDGIEITAREFIAVQHAAIDRDVADALFGEEG